LITNRHVVLPWEYDEAAKMVMAQGLMPVMRRLQGYLPGIPEAFEVRLVVASDVADLAVLECGAITGTVDTLPLSDRPPDSGDEVIVLGYPTGIRALLARADEAFMLELSRNQDLDFWAVAALLARKGHIAPLASRGIVAQVVPTAIVYDAETTRGGSGGPVLDFAISEDGHTVASSGVGVLVWDLATLEVKAELFGHSGSVDEIDISPDGRLLLTSSSSDRTTRLWDLTPFWAHELIGLPGPDALPGAVAFSPGGDQLAASRGSNQVTLWSPLNGTELQTLDDTGTVSSLAFSAAGDLLASAGESGTVIHDLLSGERLLLHTGPATEIVFGPGDVLAVDTPDGIRLWEPPVSGEGQRVIPTPFSSTVAFAPNGEMLAIGGPLGVEIYQVDGIHIRNLYGPPPSPPPPNVLALSFDPTGSLLVSAGDDFSAVLWSTETFQPLHHLEGHTGVVLDAVFDPTRPQVATADDHGTVKLWNAETGALRVSISVPGGISDLSYSPDGKYLAAISEQGFVTVLILEIDELVAEAKEGLTRWWTETECRQHLASEVCPPAPDHLTD